MPEQSVTSCRGWQHNNCFRSDSGVGHGSSARTPSHTVSLGANGTKHVMLLTCTFSSP
jgi:hypothetical protein